MDNRKEYCEKRYEKLIYYYAHKFKTNKYSADDIYQECITKILSLPPGKYNKSYIQKHCKWICLNLYNKNKRYTPSLSTPCLISEELELIDTIEAKNESLDIGIKDEADHFQKIIKNKFKQLKMTHRNKYSYQMLYNFWYDKEINNLSLSEIMNKYSIITYKATKGLSERVEKIWLEIRQQIIDDNPSTYY